VHPFDKFLEWGVEVLEQGAEVPGTYYRSTTTFFGIVHVINFKKRRISWAARGRKNKELKLK